MVGAGCAKRPLLPAQAETVPVAALEAERGLVMPMGGGKAAEPPAPFLEPLSATVYFGFDSDQLTWEARAQVERIAAQADGRAVRLVGGACPIGPEAYNEGLGLRRAQAVAALMPGGCEVESVGENVLISPIPSLYHLNRRCEIEVR